MRVRGSLDRQCERVDGEPLLRRDTTIDNRTDYHDNGASGNDDEGPINYDYERKYDDYHAALHDKRAAGYVYDPANNHSRTYYYNTGFHHHHGPDGALLIHNHDHAIPEHYHYVGHAGQVNDDYYGPADHTHD